MLVNLIGKGIIYEEHGSYTNSGSTVCLSDLPKIKRVLLNPIPFLIHFIQLHTFYYGGSVILPNFLGKPPSLEIISCKLHSFNTEWKSKVVRDCNHILVKTNRIEEGQ